MGAFSLIVVINLLNRDINAKDILLIKQRE